MKERLLGIVAILFFLVISTPAQAITGSLLLEACENGAAEQVETWTMDLGFCVGRIGGAVDGLHLFDRNHVFCLPKGVETKQQQRVVIQYLQENPQELHNWDISLIINAMAEAFPCKETEPNAK